MGRVARHYGHRNENQNVPPDRTLTRTRTQLAGLAGASFAATTLVAGWIAIHFELYEPALLETLGAVLLIAMHLLLLGLMVHRVRAVLDPVLDWLTTRPRAGALPESLDRRLGSFSGTYWSVFLLYVLLVPATYQLGGLLTGPTDGIADVLQFGLLHLVVAIFIGMPGYLLGLSRLGRLAPQTGVGTVHVRMRTQLLLVGSYLPLLTSALLLKYYWWRTGWLQGEVVLVWVMLGATSVLGTVLAIHNLRQGLQPVRELITASGALNQQDLGRRLRPQSHDEIGQLVQTLGRLVRRLDDRESHVHAVIEAVAEGVLVVDARGHIRSSNPATEASFGYPAAQVRGRPLSLLLPELMRDDGSVHVPAHELETEGVHRDGHLIPTSVRVSPMHSEGEPLYAVLVADLTERLRAQRLLVEAQTRYRDLVELAHDLVWIMDTSGRWVYMNKAAQLIYGYAPEEMVNRHFSEFQAPDAALRDRKAMGTVLDGQELLQYETVHLDRDGNRLYLSFNARPVFNAQGQVVQITGTGRDITDQRRYQRQLTFQAQHDSLTGLYNRDYFQQELQRVVARLGHSRGESALFYLDLDQFKYVNDTLGHAAGDRLLLECTRMLKAQLREGDLLARFGGDEFTLLVYTVDAQAAMHLAEQLCRSFDEMTFVEGGVTCNVSCSIGVAMISPRTVSADEALAQADLACNAAKARGRNRVTLYNPLDRGEEDMAEDMSWAARVRTAFEHDRFQLAFQPIVCVASGEVHDYEVLLRMTLESGEVILPGDFLPAAERFGLMHSVDRWTVTRALERLGTLQATGRQLRFAINLSARAFEDKGLLPLIDRALSEHGIDPASVTFEITETAAIANLAAAVDFITRLKALGCQFALDDFGSGFSSFTYLKHLPVDKLKIDGAFVQGMAHASADQAMVQAMNQVAHALGKQTIAEFVENARTLRLLRAYGVDFAQGYYLGRPSADLSGRPGSRRARQ